LPLILIMVKFTITKVIKKNLSKEVFCFAKI
jgi:hypothetical protein